MTATIQEARSVKENKQRLRQAMRETFVNFDVKSRLDAENKAMVEVLDLCKGHQFVLSYASFGPELGTGKLNAQLAKEGRLLLPKVDGENLRIYHVNDIESDDQVVKSSWGILEPHSEKCREVSVEMISVVIVPGVAFDDNGFRLGYGKGLYDRFLLRLDSKVVSIGIGFKHQLVETGLPIESHDIPLSRTRLF